MSFRQGIDGISAQISTSGQFRIAALFIVSLSLFFPVLYRLINLWATNPDYSHGFFVLPIAVFMLWRKRSQLVTVELQPSWIGLPVFILSVVSYTISFAANFHTLTHLLMIVILLSLVLFIAGWPLMRLAYLSILFIIFMFPIPESYYILLTNPLKLLITSISAGVINILGIPVYQDGNLLFFADTKLEVAEACSGIRSLYSYIMLSCVMALMCKKRSSKIIVILSTVPLAIFVNILRVTGTGLLANSFGSEVAQGFFHEFTGFILFIVGLVGLSALYYILEHGFVYRLSKGSNDKRGS